MATSLPLDLSRVPIQGGMVLLNVPVQCSNNKKREGRKERKEKKKLYMRGKTERKQEKESIYILVTIRDPFLSIRVPSLVFSSVTTFVLE